MKKKILSLGMATMMLTSLIPMSAHADANEKYVGAYDVTPKNWTINYNTTRTTWNTEQDYIGTTTEARSGKAICVNIDSYTEVNRTITLAQDVTGVTGDIVTIGFWHKGTSTDFAVKVGSKAVNFSAFTKGETDGNWTYYSTEVTASDDYSSITFEFSKTALNAVIDEISVKVGSDEIIQNGSLDEYQTAYSLDVTNEYYRSGTWTPEVSNSSVKYNDVDIKPIKKYAHSGKYAMYVNYTDNEDTAKHVSLVSKTMPDLTAGEYTMEFYTKEESITDKADISFGIFKITASGTARTYSGVEGCSFTLNSVTGELCADGFTRYTKTFTVEEDITKWGQGGNQYGFGIKIDTTAKMVIDDVKLYKTGSEENLVPDGGFETDNIALARTAGGLNTSNQTSWYANKNNISKAEVFAEASVIDGHNSNTSMRIAAPIYRTVQNPSFANTFLYVRHKLNLDAGKYNVGFYIKGDVGDYIQLTFNALSVTKNVTADELAAIEADADGWRYVEKTIDVNKQITDFAFSFDRSIDEIFIDDVTLFKDGDALKTNLFGEDGTFENMWKISPVYATAIKNPVAHAIHNQGLISISWKNPDNAFISDIDVYVDDKEYRNSVINTSPKATNAVFVGGLKVNTTYPIKLVATIEGKEYVTEFFGTTTGGSEQMIGTFRYGQSSAKKDELLMVADTSVSLDTSETPDGTGASVRFNANLPQLRSNIYPSLIKKVTLEQNKKYKVSVDAKVESDGGVRFKLNRSKNWENDKQYFIKENALFSKDWEKYSVNISAYDEMADAGQIYEDTFYINFDLLDGVLWIDNLELYEVDDNGERVNSNENLFGDGYFEYDNWTISDATFKNVIGTAVVDTTKVEPGTVRVSTKVKNNFAGDNFNVAMLVALYDNDRFVSLTKMEKTVAETPLFMSAEDFVVDVVVPEEEGEHSYSIKVMYWDGFKYVKPWRDYDIFPAEK